jgi:hypothetical protein
MKTGAGKKNWSRRLDDKLTSVVRLHRISLGCGPGSRRAVRSWTEVGRRDIARRVRSQYASSASALQPFGVEAMCSQTRRVGACRRAGWAGTGNASRSGRST